MSLPVTTQWYWYVFNCVMESTLNCWQFLLILLKLIVAKKKKKRNCNTIIASQYLRGFGEWDDGVSSQNHTHEHTICGYPSV